MKSISLALLLLALVFSCNSPSSSGEGNYLFWDIEHFYMVEDALEDGEEVKLVYTSNGLGNNKDLTFYYHLIVVSQQSGDTVNVLTSANHGFKKGDEHEVFNFFGKDNMATKILQLNENQLEEGQTIDPESIEMKEITKVARDPEFDFAADNTFPTVIGAIGKQTKP